MFPTFSERVPKWSANILNNFHAIWRVLSVKYLLRYPILSPVIQVSYRSFNGASLGGLFIVPQLSLILSFSEVLGSTATRLRATSRKFLFLTYIFLVSIWRRFSQASSILYDVFLSVAVFPRVLQGGEDKIELTAECFSSVLRVSYYRLILSRSDFAKNHTR